MDIASYEQTQETLALLKVLAIADKEIEAGETVSAEEIMAEYGMKGKRAR